jgi:hypothetical protein
MVSKDYTQKSKTDSKKIYLVIFDIIYKKDGTWNEY